MGWQPGPEGGTGADPDRDPGTPGGAEPVRDPRLAVFAPDASRDTSRHRSPDGSDASRDSSRHGSPGSSRDGSRDSSPDGSRDGSSYGPPDSSRGGPVPSGRLALLADEVSGPERRCPGATDGELIGLVRAWAGIESWAAGAKLGVIRELIRRADAPLAGGYHGDLPDEWPQSLRYELAAALACSTQSAETTTWLAWEQRARLPGTGARLDDGTLTPAKA